MPSDAADTSDASRVTSTLVDARVSRTRFLHNPSGRGFKPYLRNGVTGRAFRDPQESCNAGLLDGIGLSLQSYVPVGAPRRRENPGLGERRVLVPGLPVGAARPRADHGPLVVAVGGTSSCPPIQPGLPWAAESRSRIAASHSGSHPGFSLTCVTTVIISFGYPASATATHGRVGGATVREALCRPGREACRDVDTGGRRSTAWHLHRADSGRAQRRPRMSRVARNSAADR